MQVNIILLSQENIKCNFLLENMNNSKTSMRKHYKKTFEFLFNKLITEHLIKCKENTTTDFVSSSTTEEIATVLLKNAKVSSFLHIRTKQSASLKDKSLK